MVEKMSEIKLFLVKLIIFSTLWYFLGYRSKTSLVDEFSASIIYYIPLAFIFSVGVYLGVKVLYQAFTFKEHPEAYEELKNDIAEACIDLKNKGMDIDSDMFD